MIWFLFISFWDCLQNWIMHFLLSIRNGEIMRARSRFQGYSCKSGKAISLHGGSIEVTLTVPLNLLNITISIWELGFLTLIFALYEISCRFEKKKTSRLTEILIEISKTVYVSSKPKALRHFKVDLVLKSYVETESTCDTYSHKPITNKMKNKSLKGL